MLRSDIYLEAMKELGVKVDVQEQTSITLFDSVIDGKDPEKYAQVVRREQPRELTTDRSTGAGRTEFQEMT